MKARIITILVFTFLGSMSPQLVAQNDEPKGPLQILVKNPSNPLTKMVVKEYLEIASLENAFNGPGNTMVAGGLENDMDSFYIRMTFPERAGSPLPMKARIITNNLDSDYDDPPSFVHLRETPPNSGVFISVGQVLVSSKIDDEQSWVEKPGYPAIEDEIINDRTHLVKLGSEVIIQVDPTGGENYDNTLTLEVAAKNHIDLKVVILARGGGEDPNVISNAGALAQVKKMRETFAQTGIWINYDENPVVINQSSIPGVNLYDGFYTFGTAALHPEEQALFNHLAANNVRTPNEITLIFVNYFVTSRNGVDAYHDPLGRAYPDQLVPAPKATNANHIIVAANDWIPMVASHELTHILLNAIHGTTPDYALEFNHLRMVWSVSNVDHGFMARKRLSKSTRNWQHQNCRNSPLVK